MKKTAEVCSKFAAVLAKAASIIPYIGYLVMILVIVCDVILRYVINSPIMGSYEIVQYLLMICVFASFPYCQILRGHIQVTMFLRLMPKKMVFIINTLTSLLTAAIMFYVAYAASQQAVFCSTKGLTTDVLDMAIAPFVWIEFVCMIIFGITCLSDVVNSIAAIFDQEMQEKLYEEWIE